MNPNPKDKKIIKVDDLLSFINKVEGYQYKDITIVFEDIQKQYQYSDIPLSLINEHLVSLDLNLIGFKPNQIDFNNFIESLNHFKYLTNFSLRFYNKKIQNLDSLFYFISRIQYVSLNLKHFRKIKLGMESIKLSNIKSLNLNLVNTTFKSAKDEMKLIEFLSSLENLEELSLKIKCKKYFRLMTAVPKQTEIYLNLISADIDIPFCDSLVEFIMDNNLQEAVEIQSIRLILHLYLIDKGIKISNHFQTANLLDTNQYQPNDFKILKQVPQFSIKIKNSTKGQLSMQGKNSQIDNFFKYLIPIIDYHQEQIVCYFKETIKKQKNQWVLDLGSLQKFYIANLVNITLSMYKGLSFDKTVFVMSQLNKSDYLISLQFKDFQNMVNNQYLEGSYKIKFNNLFSLLCEQINIVQQRSLDKLRYFVFRKTIYDIIPIPDQIFYDLIDI